MATRLSVNINKIALIRNARGGNYPNLLVAAQDIESYGAQGITIHPRPDERHVRFEDAMALQPIIETEFNIEGYPSEKWLDLVKIVKPAQATLVPDDPNQVTSDHGWNTIKDHDFLVDVIGELGETGCRVSLFIDPVDEMIAGAKEVGADRVELYTGPYANDFVLDPESAVEPYVKASEFATKISLELNAGHDLNLQNLPYLIDRIPNIREVSIGHALISDALYFGLEHTIKRYLKELA